MPEHTDQELESLIRFWDRSAEHHVELAKRAHTEFQRLFHERRASEALLRAHRYRKELAQRRETRDNNHPLTSLADRRPQG